MPHQNWKATIVVDGVCRTAEEWVDYLADGLKDIEILSFLENNGFKTSRNAVKMKMWRLGKSPANTERKSSKSGKSLEFKKEKNTATITSTSARIRTLEQLLEAAQVDLSVWRVDRYIVNKWEVGAKPRWADLEFDHGRISGSLHEEGLQVEPLWQVKAWLVRIVPIPLFPTIQPIECSIKFPRPAKKRAKGIHSALICADPQFGYVMKSHGKLLPFHDRRALDVFLQVARCEKPDRIDILGDWFDFTSWTDKFLRSPEFEKTTQPAICESYWWLAQLRNACPDTQITLHEGNHDFRMRAYIMSHAKAAYELKAADEMELPPALSVPKLLALHKLHVKWVGDYPNDEDWLNERIRLSHGETTRAGAADASKVIVKDSDFVEVMGHVHKVELATRVKGRDGEGRVNAACCPGCLCHVDKRLPWKSRRQNWQQGFAKITYQVDGDYYDINLGIIDQGKVLWGKRLYTARDRLVDIQRDLPGWNWG